MCVICVQWIAESHESLKDPSISEEEKDQLKRNVKGWKDYIQKYQEQIVFINSALEEKNSAQQGESCMLSSYCSCSCRLQYWLTQ